MSTDDFDPTTDPLAGAFEESSLTMPEQGEDPAQEPFDLGLDDAIEEVAGDE